MKRFFEWIFSLFKRKVEIPECTLLPDPNRPLAARRMAPRTARRPRPKPTPTTGPHLLFFNFEGGAVRYSTWNGGQQINLMPSVMIPSDRQQALWAAMEAYAPYNLIITDKIAEYNNHTGPKQMVYISPSSSWYPNGVSGIAHINSFGNLGDVAFVFEDRLFSRWDFVGDIMIHESGHTLGLRHQSNYDASCNLIDSYKFGCHMGNPFNMDAQWIVGPTYTCTAMQDDKAILTQKLGLK